MNVDFAFIFVSFEVICILFILYFVNVMKNIFEW